MKPRLRLVHTKCWMCTGAGFAAFGPSPITAYTIWRAISYRLM